MRIITKDYIKIINYSDLPNEACIKCVEYALSYFTENIKKFFKQKQKNLMLPKQYLIIKFTWGKRGGGHFYRSGKPHDISVSLWKYAPNNSEMVKCLLETLIHEIKHFVDYHILKLPFQYSMRWLHRPQEIRARIHARKVSVSEELINYITQSMEKNND